jgi:hypothetical protein
MNQPIQLLQLRGMLALLMSEAIVAVVGLLSLWAIWVLRDQPDTEPELLPAELAEPGRESG